MASSESIVKDSFYKSRLLRSTLNNFNDSLTAFDAPSTLKGLAKEVIHQSLKDFKKTAKGENYAFLTFQCNHQQIESIDQLSPYVYLSNVDISNNNVRSLRVLSSLRYLVSLNASHNQVDRLLELRALPYSLESVDLSFNEIEEMADLSQHKYLRVLKLQKNRISHIQGLKKNMSLRVLDLSENEIENIEGLDNLNLVELNLSGNKISLIKGLSKLQKLRVLNLCKNSISKLRELGDLVSLRELYLSKNDITQINELLSLEGMTYLQQLDLCFNALQEVRYYRNQILFRLPMLEVLDGTPVTPVEVVKAENMYGIDVAARAQIFKDILPEEDFVDRRIHVSELIEAETDAKEEGKNGFIDQYDEESRKVEDDSSRRADKSFLASKTSNFSKGSRGSKASDIRSRGDSKVSAPM